MTDPIAFVAYVGASQTDAFPTATVHLRSDSASMSLWTAVGDAAGVFAERATAHVDDLSISTDRSAELLLQADAEHSDAVRQLRSHADAAGSTTLAIEAWTDDLRAARLLAAVDACEHPDVPRAPARAAVTQATEDLVARTHRAIPIPSLPELARGLAAPQHENPGTFEQTDTGPVFRVHSRPGFRWLEAEPHPAPGTPQPPVSPVLLGGSADGVAAAALGVLDAVSEGVLSEFRAIGEGLVGVLPASLVAVRKRVETAIKDAGRFLRRALERIAEAIEWVLTQVGLAELTHTVERAKGAVEAPKTLLPPLLGIPTQKELIAALPDDLADRPQAVQVAEAYLALLHGRVDNTYADLADMVKTVVALAGVAMLIPIVGSRVRSLTGIFLAGALAYAIHIGRYYVQGPISRDKGLSVGGTLAALRDGQIAEIQLSLAHESESKAGKA